jgi:hypothetical protein
LRHQLWCHQKILQESGVYLPEPEDAQRRSLLDILLKMKQCFNHSWSLFKSPLCTIKHHNKRQPITDRKSDKESKKTLLFFSCLWSHLYHLVSLCSLVTHVHAGSPTALVVTDTLGNLSGLQLLKVVALGATPLVDLLWEEGYITNRIRDVVSIDQEFVFKNCMCIWTISLLKISLFS